MERLGIIFPWFGCDFSCRDANCAAVIPSASGDHPILPEDYKAADGYAWNLKDGGCGASQYSGPGYAQVLELSANATAPPLLDKQSMTKHMLWRNGSGDMHDVWFDDPETLAPKYRATKAAGMRAIGMWTPDATRWNAMAAREMWGAIPAPNKTAALLGTAACERDLLLLCPRASHTIADCYSCVGRHFTQLRGSGCEGPEINSYCADAALTWSS